MFQIYFETLTDERQNLKIKHSLLEMVVMIIYMIIVSCDV